MSRSLDADAVLVPVSRKKEERALEAHLPTPEECGLPPRVRLEQASELIRHMTKWGERGGDFLKNVFFDQDHQPRHALLEDMVGHCLGCSGKNSGREVRDAAIRFVECLESCGLIVSAKSPIMRTRYTLNPTPGVSDLLEVREQEGAKILKVVDCPFVEREAAGYLQERIGDPFKPGTSCAELVARLTERTLLSQLLKDRSLYVDGYHQGLLLREKLAFYLNEGIRVGLIKFEVILKDGEEREVFSLTERGSRYLNITSRD